ncbi:hypothetical protein [Aliikangiella maris]|uniref:Uncharacterized protein n=2 Tax=Aliikangiella maris TaxID=3162458 RepID=A0ABV3MQT0_9GAMM
MSITKIEKGGLSMVLPKSQELYRQHFIRDVLNFSYRAVRYYQRTFYLVESYSLKRLLRKLINEKVFTIRILLFFYNHNRKSIQSEIRTTTSVELAFAKSCASLEFYNDYQILEQTLYLEQQILNWKKKKHQALPAGHDQHVFASIIAHQQMAVDWLQEKILLI